MKLMAGVRVLDISRLIPGPYAGMLLADMGADVIKLEDTGVGDYYRLGGDEERGGMRLIYAWLNRNRRSLSVDFRQAEGLEMVHRLAKTCDVLLEGARPGASAKLGLGYEDLRALNSKIVYCSLSGFGQEGPFAHLGTHGGAYDSVTGLAVPYQVKDGSYIQWRPFPHALVYGSWLAAMAICAALVRARSTGEGSYLDISCADAALMGMGQEIMPVLNGEDDGWGDPEDHVSVKYCYYKTKDDKFMLIQAIEQKFWEHFCDVVDRPDLKARGDWSKGLMDSGNRDLALKAELIELFRAKTQAEWTEIFIRDNIAGAPYYGMNEVEDSELFRDRAMVVEQEHPVAGEFKMVGNAVNVLGDPFTIDRPAPTQGEQTEEVLAEIGYSESQIAEFRSRHLIK